MLRFKITIQALNLRHKRLHRSSKPNNRPVPECLTLGALLTPLVLPSATLKLVKNKFYNSICSLVLVYTSVRNPQCGLVEALKIQSLICAMFRKWDNNQGHNYKEKTPEGGFGVAKVFLCPAGTLLDLRTIISIKLIRYFNDCRVNNTLPKIEENCFFCSEICSKIQTGNMGRKVFRSNYPSGSLF